MSLLLDALKKAERAKDDARRREQLAEGSNADQSGIQVRTRNELPDISKPLEIHPEDVPGRVEPDRSDSPVPDAFSTAPRSPPREPVTVRANSPDASSKRRQAPSARENAPDVQSAQRAAAKQVFEAKFREPNPKLPFLITMALLGAFATGTVVYFWYQLRPPPPLVNTNAKPPSEEKKLEGVSTQPAAGATASLPVGAPMATEAQAMSGLPSQRPAVANQAAAPAFAAKPPAPTVALVVASPKPSSSPETARVQGGQPVTAQRQSGSPREPRAVSDQSQLSINRAAPSVNPKIETAWQAYNQGDLTAARSNYQAMLREEPTNRDALLGMAAIEIRANRPEQAEIYYRSLIQVNPRDPYAQTGLLAIRGQMGDPVQAESRVKNLLANDPEAQVLNFTLGNQYAQQGRWPEAQQAYFKAYSADPDNPDFAYNLAVSLDQVRQPKLALEYYRRALSLAQQRSSSFEQTLARNRVQELAR